MRGISICLALLYSPLAPPSPLLSSSHTHSFLSLCHLPSSLPLTSSCSPQLWDMRVRTPTATLNNRWPVLSVAYSDVTNQLFAAGIDSSIKARVLLSLSLPRSSLPCSHCMPPLSPLPRVSRLPGSRIHSYQLSSFLPSPYHLVCFAPSLSAPWVLLA